MNNRNPIADKVHFYFGVFMIAFYALMGLMLIFVLNFLEIHPANRIAFGCALILYACYRTIKLIRGRGIHRATSSTNQENESA